MQLRHGHCAGLLEDELIDHMKTGPPYMVLGREEQYVCRTNARGNAPLCAE